MLPSQKRCLHYFLVSRRIRCHPDNPGAGKKRGVLLCKKKNEGDYPKIQRTRVMAGKRGGSKAEWRLKSIK